MTLTDQEERVLDFLKTPRRPLEIAVELDTSLGVVAILLESLQKAGKVEPLSDGSSRWGLKLSAQANVTKSKILTLLESGPKTYEVLQEKTEADTAAMVSALVRLQEEKAIRLGNKRLFVLSGI